MAPCQVLVRSEQPCADGLSLSLRADRRSSRDVFLDSHASALVHQFAPISLAELDSAALLSRADTKYLLAADRLYPLLVALEPDYRLLEIAGQRLHRYQTLYYDTPEYTLYRLHHNDARQRFKGRSRRYADTGQSFLEIKIRAGADRTDKSRLPVRGLPEKLTPAMQAFIAEHVSHETPALVPQVANAFSG